ncbi:beta-1,3-glucanase family protein [Chitinophaga sancti]|uniref:Beta-1,3-glucanase n=1 Tax=Chitinophaga sancti TaxID=1004 RepID=A0A1K1SLM7_9BACT|nr:beta-1,3-glucanase family protein [Chitinophaga sancti]WQD63897.1 beta-1,3-glucanase family protein [Chitinophaga sancti]WQG90478.1 beta-1,3-glucanase family protein [Chitinophaga sancti]SFW85328.1 Beta-1,3-glucanase [Chitinophaga sancti]
MKTITILAAMPLLMLMGSCKKTETTKIISTGPIDYNAYANGGVHLEIVNSDPATYNDDELYVGVMGATTGSNSTSAYIDLKTGKTVPLNNLSALPQVVNPNNPTDGGKFIVIGTKMSDMPVNPATGRHSIPLPFIQSGRILMSIGKPIYYYINPGGTSLAAPTKSTNPKDQNYGTVFDFMEFTYYSNGTAARVYANTSRVDEYAISMGFELNALQGKTGTVQRAGELMTKQNTIQAFLNFPKPEAYNQCYRSFFQDIINPGGITDAAGNKIFTQTAAYAQFQTYIDSIWQNYKTKDLLLVLGTNNVGKTDADLVIKGRVDDNNVFNFTQTTTVNGTKVTKAGTLPIKPTTSDVLGGTASTGAFNNSALDGKAGHELDNSLRVTFVAALNRHSIVADAAEGKIQYPEDVSNFYKHAPYNYYAAFWHSQGVSYNNLQYAFSYDDAANQSSTIVGDNPAYCTLYFGPIISK